MVGDGQQQGWQRHLTGSRDRINAELARWQEKRRLAAHIFEDNTSFCLAPAILDGDLVTNAALLRQFRDDPKHADVKKNEVPLISVSPFPSPHSGKHIHPSNFKAVGGKPGYIFKLDEMAELPPVVVRVMPDVGFYTGYDNRNKHYLLGESKLHPAFLELYGAYSHGDKCPKLRKAEKEKALLNAAIRDPQRFYGALDILGGLYENTTHSRTPEALVIVAPEHIMGIVMPVSKISHMHTQTQADTDMLTLALAGLAHKTMDLPLVTYDTATNALQCVAANQQECRELALTHIQKLQDQPGFWLPAYNESKRFKEMQAAAQELLGGVDIKIRLAQQGIAMSAQGRAL